ncbi:MAG TPA: hypothetical protein DIT89_16590 [Planctomycetaceae bacterium]|nr:hypothetical protein [Planctomycetaceae bacterium]
MRANAIRAPVQLAVDQRREYRPANSAEWWAAGRGVYSDWQKLPFKTLQPNLPEVSGGWTVMNIPIRQLLRAA